MTDRGLECTQGGGQDILTVNRHLDPELGDSFGFRLRGSDIENEDYSSGRRVNEYGTFLLGDRDTVSDFALMMPRIASQKLERLEGVEVVELPKTDQVFASHKISPHKAVGCVALNFDAIEARAGAQPIRDEFKALFDMLAELNPVLEDLLGRERRLPEAQGPSVQRRASQYPSFDFAPGFKPVFLAEQTHGSLTMHVDRSNRTRLPAASALEFASWVSSNLGDLKSESVWSRNPHS